MFEICFGKEKEKIENHIEITDNKCTQHRVKEVTDSFHFR